jgi:hypothetical protein
LDDLQFISERLATSFKTPNLARCCTTLSISE